MARKVRLYPDAIYHRMNRGDRQPAAAMKARLPNELDQEFRAMRLGWSVGFEEFRLEMLRYVEQLLGALN